MARDLDRLTRINGSAPAGAGGSAVSRWPMAVHGTIPVDFAMLTEGLGLVRSARRAVLDDSPLVEQLLEDPMARLEEHRA